MFLSNFREINYLPRELRQIYVTLHLKNIRGTHHVSHKYAYLIVCYSYISVCTNVYSYISVAYASVISNSPPLPPTRLPYPLGHYRKFGNFHFILTNDWYTQSYVSRMLFVCYSYVIRMLFVCYSYVIRMLFVCYSYVSRM